MLLTFDKSTGKFRDERGRFISEFQVHLQINKLVDKVEKEFRSIAQNLNQGKINLPEFQNKIAERIKTSHVLAASVGKGGRRQMTSSDWGTVGNAVKEQYQFLNKFAREIQAGRVSVNQIVFRASLYSKSVRTIFYKFEKRLKDEAGKMKCRRVLHAAESCVECSSWAAKGFIAIEEQPAIGSLLCKNFCRCELLYL